MSRLHTPVIKSIVAGFLGTLLALGIWHLYNDHLVFHNLISAIQEQNRLNSEKK